jgi:hypothetical protein
MEIDKREAYSFRKLVLRPIGEGGQTVIDYTLPMTILKSQESFSYDYGGDIDLVEY